MGNRTRVDVIRAPDVIDTSAADAPTELVLNMGSYESVAIVVTVLDADAGGVTFAAERNDTAKVTAPGPGPHPTWRRAGEVWREVWATDEPVAVGESRVAVVAHGAFLAVTAQLRVTWQPKCPARFGLTVLGVG